MRHSDFQPQVIREFLQVFFDEMLVGSVAAAAIA